MTLSLPERKQSRDDEESLKRISSSLSQYQAEVALQKAEIQQAMAWQYQKSLENLKQRLQEKCDQSHELRLQHKNQLEMERRLRELRERLEEKLEENNWE